MLKGEIKEKKNFTNWESKTMQRCSSETKRRRHSHTKPGVHQHNIYLETVESQYKQEELTSSTKNTAVGATSTIRAGGKHFKFGVKVTKPWDVITIPSVIYQWVQKYKNKGGITAQRKNRKGVKCIRMRLLSLWNGKL